jgi:hypothetical protein
MHHRRQAREFMLRAADAAKELDLVAPTAIPAPPAVVDRSKELTQEARRKHAAAVAHQAEQQAKLDAQETTCATVTKRAAELEADAAVAKAARAKAELVLKASHTRAALLAKRAQKYPGNKEVEHLSEQAVRAISKAKAAATEAQEHDDVIRRKADKFKAKKAACVTEAKKLAQRVEANNRRLQAEALRLQAQTASVKAVEMLQAADDATAAVIAARSAVAIALVHGPILCRCNHRLTTLGASYVRAVSLVIVICFSFSHFAILSVLLFFFF